MNRPKTIVVGYSQLMEVDSDENRKPFLSSWTNSAMLKLDGCYRIKTYIKRLDASADDGEYAFTAHGLETFTYTVGAADRVSDVMPLFAAEVSITCDKLFDDVGVSGNSRVIVWPHAKAAFWRPLRLRFGLGRAAATPRLTLMDPIDMSFDDTFPTGGDRLGITPEDLRAMAYRDMVTPTTPVTVMTDLLKLCNLPV